MSPQLVQLCCHRTFFEAVQFPYENYPMPVSIHAAVARGQVPWKEALDGWQQYRLARVDRTVETDGEDGFEVAGLDGWRRRCD